MKESQKHPQVFIIRVEVVREHVRNSSMCTDTSYEIAILKLNFTDTMYVQCHFYNVTEGQGL